MMPKDLSTPVFPKIHQRKRKYGLKSEYFLLGILTCCQEYTSASVQTHTPVLLAQV